MRFAFVLSLVAGAAGLFSPKVDYHLAHLVETLPLSTELIQLQALTLPGANAPGIREELATLLNKMVKDIQTDQAVARKQNTAFQNKCDRNLRHWRHHRDRAKKYMELHAKRMATHYAEQAKAPAIIAECKRQQRLILIKVAALRVKISNKQKERNKNRELYLKSIRDFNKALDDVAQLRILVENGLSNRGDGADVNEARYTHSPTVKGYTHPPTQASFDRAQHHDAANTGKDYNGTHAMFLELRSTQELASMNRDEAIATMKGIYHNLRATVGKNPMVVALVDTLDSVMQQVGNGNSVDKIRDLLTQVRNELQKSKREQTEAENDAIRSWKIEKINLYDQVNDALIEHAQLSIECTIDKGWVPYHYHWKAYGHNMIAWAQNQYLYHDRIILIQFEDARCKKAHREYLAMINKTDGQLQQLKKALDILSKFSMGGKYGEMIKDSLKDVTAGLCKDFDYKSKYVPYLPSATPIRRITRKGFPSFNQEAWNVYQSLVKGKKEVCVKNIQFTFTCSAECDIRITDRRLVKNIEGDNGRYRYNRFPRVAHISNPRDFNKPKKFTVRLKESLEWLGGTKLYAIVQKGRIIQNDVSAFVVPNCNCNKHRNKDYDVQANAANTKEADKAAYEDENHVLYGKQ
jgi:hypothetical protein